MKTLPAGLQTHLDTGTTTMCFCWKVTRQDGEVQGFTEHDEDITFDGVTYAASTGFTATAIQASLGLSVDNLNVDGGLSSDTINEVDLAAGRYDAAAIELHWVNWQDLSQRMMMSKGIIGEVKRGETTFSAELRSLTQLAQQKVGRTYQRYCDARLGDARCGVNIESLRQSGSIQTIVSTRRFTSTTISGDNDWYTLGLITFTSGANSGLTFEIRTHWQGGGNHTIMLWVPPPFPVVVNDTYTIVPGCKKDEGTCHAKFNNITNFQGFSLMPGNDAVARYPKRGEAGQDGRSLFSG